MAEIAEMMAGAARSDERLRYLEVLVDQGGEPVALFDTQARVLVAAPALTAVVGGGHDRLEGGRLDEAGCPMDVAARLRSALDRVTATRQSMVMSEPRLLPGREIVLSPVCDLDQHVWAIGASCPPAPKAQVGRFLSAANHDLRQPFQAMHLFHHLLSSRLTDARQIDFAEKLGHSIAAADHGLASLVLAARLDAGLIVPDMRPFPLALVLIPLLEEFRSRAAEAKLELRAHYGPAGGDVAVLSDQNLLEAALRQLFDNAIRFTETGGVLFGVRRRDTSLRLEVWDTGSGIPETERDVVWDDFRRLDPPPRNGVSGMGLGLGIVRRIGRLLDHPVCLRSRSHRGSVATLSVALAG